MFANKKAQKWIEEPIKIGFFIFLVVISLLVMTKLNDKAQTSSSYDAASKTLMQSALDNMTSGFNWAIPILIIAGVIVMIIITKQKEFVLVEKIGISIGFIFVVFMLTIPANIYDEAKANNTDFNTVSSTVPMIDYFMSNLLQFGTLMIGIVLYFVFTSEGDKTT